MKLNKFFVTALGFSLIVTADTSFAAFGGSRASSGMGVSRSYSRPSTPKSSYTAPASKSYSKPSYSNSSSSNNYSKPSYNSSNGGGNYNNSGYNNQYRQRSTMGDIGVGVASVAGGILAAEAIQGLIRGPSGAYTHPQYPGQTFNAQGVPQPAQGQVMPPQEGSVQPSQQQSQQPVYVVQQAPVASTGGFFSFLWSALGNILHLILYVSVVGALAYAGWKLYKLGKKKFQKEKANMLFDVETEFENLDASAMEIFYDFQKNSDNKDWVKRNTKYLNVEACMSEPSTVEQYQHKVLDCAVEQGKLRASVRYDATLENDRLEKINQIWNFEKDLGVWKLIGVEPV